MKTKSYRELFVGNVDISLKTAAKILSAYPSSASAFIKLAGGLKKAESLRKQSANDGLEVPPLMIVSTTQACNLTCAGCYSCAQNKKYDENLSVERIIGLFDEAAGLGISIVMLAGGEPLLSHGWMDVLALHNEMVGVVFTNGTLFDEGRIEWFDRHRHVFPALSIEGDEQRTDTRRGKGVYQTVEKTMGRLKEAGIPFGISVTVTSKNIEAVLSDAFITEYIQKGCRLFIFVEYVPIEPGSEAMLLSNEEKKQLNRFAEQRVKKHPALFIPFPGDEDMYGGCLAAGRGFIHVSASGDVEPCPFAPFSDTNLKTSTLRDALASDFLSKIRENHHLLKEGNGGCALWNNREWLEKLKQE